jgi:hypothetical protein
LVERLSVSKKWEMECTSRLRLASFSPILRSQYIAQYADKLAIVMKKILLISQVASLGRDFEKYVGTRGDNMEAPHVDGLDEMDGLLNYSADDASLDGRSSNIDVRSSGRPSLFGNSSEGAATEDNVRFGSFNSLELGKSPRLVLNRRYAFLSYFIISGIYSLMRRSLVSFLFFTDLCLDRLYSMNRSWHQVSSSGVPKT